MTSGNRHYPLSIRWGTDIASDNGRGILAPQFRAEEVKGLVLGALRGQGSLPGFITVTLAAPVVAGIAKTLTGCAALRSEFLERKDSLAAQHGVGPGERVSQR